MKNKSKFYIGVMEFLKSILRIVLILGVAPMIYLSITKSTEKPKSPSYSSSKPFIPIDSLNFKGP